MDPQVYKFVDGATKDILYDHPEMVKPKSLIQKTDRIGPKGMDPIVYDFVDGATKNILYDDPELVKPKTLAQRQDIAEAKMEANVHAFANDNTEVTNWPRSKDAFIPNGSQSGWARSAAAFSQKDDEKEKEVVVPNYTSWQYHDQTEKVHILEPEKYQVKANTNSPNMRTTFYDKKNGVWMQGMDF
jgi:hypothetical protein